VVFLHKNIFTDRLPKSLFLLKPIFLIIESIVFVVRLILLIRGSDIHIVHSHLFSANLWGRLAVLLGGRQGMVTTEHSVSERNKSIKRKAFNRLLLPICDRVVAVSDAVAEAVLIDQGVNRNKLTVIPNGIRCSEQSVQTVKGDPDVHENVLPGTRPRIAAIGRLIPVKRYDLLLEALKISAKRIPNLSCCIIGDGKERTNLESMVKRLQLTDKVFFLGERLDVRNLLHYIDLVVCTSDREGLPMNLLEALDEEVPVVATNVGGVGEVIKTDNTGILVEPGNAKAVAEAICRMIENPDMAKKMGRAGRAVVKSRYSLNRVARLWEKLYQEVFEEQKKRRHFNPISKIQ